MIAIIDYGMGNLQSVANILDYIGEKNIITNKTKEIELADKLILPGVGAFGEAMENLKKLGLVEVLSNEVMEVKKPFLGICLGMQLLADKSYEIGEHNGLGFIKGEVKKLTPEGDEYRIPHIGWNDVEPQRECVLYGNDMSPKICYFVHSFHFDCENKEDITGVTDYGGKFVCSLERGNIMATQFHPEKSQKDGIEMMRKFVKY
ncbi:MAG: imidazole glycerol phosphate synthase, glutamine amidotransferase subunit [Candidatus Magasanikbacteria bacterium RIFCSPHIGHO2_01_FULL_33_34]|uniref:Imidazole glycerol phosphate synthase subunit HisH n=1 Tax=Candidatus Magasanikbacteria bacterium RIFCSPHIGHO2_01_FULL_33_34 TaxID=1798671 RepID=A0A1F6LJD0_9BACT|nr:MAG: imidazole glycerol phosphate synthase, glutamine amidotransferase subunit [Candidatus Magasanikbacteria bacterium RIFCSPHIGHO2_01_FULL_33_34]OGH65348.1 MAG: imidazole glycerol phosphate synthase, glutamine amidotransferase subunit [Candidatus Magasanikbacteria bacterium RIFCSPHIGHO2_02_FULL_33_17]OGH76124.1 MAG: imidazole glycerol phosphate synthase, glutamine amidotransferase subunit [Candidatus Magasanikbacteria bacterium RIFCSPLOWO2_01_FULL_33_34]OGH81075.1 MAG: imidazole glycerol pho